MNQLYKNVNYYSKSVLSQLYSITTHINQEEYTMVTKNIYGKQTNSSIGSHVRHIYDHFDKLLIHNDNSNVNINDNMNNIPVIDYDTRDRGTTIEINKNEALDKHFELISKIDQLVLN